MKNLIIRSLLLSIFIMGSVSNYSADAQNRYRVWLTDKNEVDFDPFSYFEAKAIERRLVNNISLCDQTDFPVSEEYIRVISEIADSISFVSRWFNFIGVYVSSEDQLKNLKSLDFVREIEMVEPVTMTLAMADDIDPYISIPGKDLLDKQLTRMGGNLFIEENIHGKGIRIAVFDGGFPWVDTHPAFEHIRKENRIVATYNFTAKKVNVYLGNKHGAMTLACIGGRYADLNIGLATEAEFLLAKTEVQGEPFSEEENWLAAAEWADKNGANIISSSLGYERHRYFTYQMDGKTSLVVKAANMAARKGILVVNAAGNQGGVNDKWKYIITPADGDSVLTIGGVNPETDYHMGYSSFGPTADKRMKPNVSAYSHIVTVNKNGVKPADGTSFATPLVAGFAACALQTNKSLKTMELFKEIEKSGHLYPYFDYAHGFGIPQASHFLKKENTVPARSFEFNLDSNSLTIRVKPEIINNQNWLADNGLLYYHLEDENGVLIEYYVIKVETPEVLKLNLGTYRKGDNLTTLKYKKGYKLMVWYHGFVDSYVF